MSKSLSAPSNPPTIPASIPATVEVRYCAQAGLARGVARERLPLPQGGTLADLLAELVARHQPLANLLHPAGERCGRSVLIFVNDQQVDLVRGALLQDSDRVMILAPMAGG